MPTAGTHITILEQIAQTRKFGDYIGYLDASEDTDSAKLLKFSKLGAIGPDIFYFLADYSLKSQPGLQDFMNFIAKFSGTISIIDDFHKDVDAKIKKAESEATAGITDVIDKFVSEIESVFKLVMGIIHDEILKNLIENYNFFSIFEAPRQQDKCRNEWFWADYLHYVDTGIFVKNLFNESKGNPNLIAFSFGYLSHFITDIVGHPFINQIVGSPWRMYWQRHHVVECYVDSYVWARWHSSYDSDEIDDKTHEQKLDRFRPVPNEDYENGSPFTFSRIHDQISVGDTSMGNPIDKFIAEVKKSISNTNILSIEPENGNDLNEWADFMARVFKLTYPTNSPQNLRKNGGYPSNEDIRQAYTFLKLFYRISTEEKLEEPENPNIPNDVTKALEKLWQDVAKYLNAIPPSPAPSIPQSLEDVWAAMKQLLEYSWKLSMALGSAAIDLLKDTIKAGATFLLDFFKAILYHLKKLLFDLYKKIRDVLVLSGYAVAFPSELSQNIIPGISARTLWTTPSESEQKNRPYPLEELAQTERATFNSRYVPWVSPDRLSEMKSKALVEHPQTLVGPYGPRQTAEDFMLRPLGPRVLLSPSGPVDISQPGAPPDPNLTEGFGGALANCIEAFKKVIAAMEAGPLDDKFFPNYNLDGDRGYAWPCWDLKNAPCQSANPDSLNPGNQLREMTVDPVLIP